jgi:hypothetical protein
VSDLPKLKFFIVVGLLIAGAWIVSPSWGQGDVAGYIYKPVEPNPNMDFSSSYQWRPADTQVHYDAQTFRGRAELMPGIRQSPADLPLGTYRPIEEVRILSPQVGEFRFRPISPEEQSRNLTAGSQAVEGYANTGRGQVRFREDEETPSVWSPEAKFKPRFRPDSRFSNNKNSQSLPSYPYPSHQYSAPNYSAPVFRQDILDR